MSVHASAERNLCNIVVPQMPTRVVVVSKKSKKIFFFFFFFLLLLIGKNRHGIGKKREWGRILAPREGQKIPCSERLTYVFGTYCIG